MLQVFCGKADYSEIALIGKLTAVLKNGNQVVTEFIAQIKFEGDVQQSPEGVLYKVWGVSKSHFTVVSGSFDMSCEMANNMFRTVRRGSKPCRNEV